MIIYSTEGDVFETSNLYLTQKLNHMSRQVKRSELRSAFKSKFGKTVSGKYSVWPKFLPNIWNVEFVRQNRKPIRASIGCQKFTGENLIKLLKWVRG